MKTTSITIAILLLLLVTITGCGNSDEIYLDVESLVDESESIIPATPGTWPPTVFVNNTLYFSFEHRQHYVAEPGDTWVYIGEIQSVVPQSGMPTENFQSNHGMAGARIYHAYAGRIPITTCVWGGVLDEEVTGDSIIVVYNGQRIMYISEEAHEQVFHIMNSVQRNSLMVDDVVYVLIASEFGGHFSADGNIFLGEVESAISRFELPVENLQTNREINVGAKIYRLPPEAIDDIVIIHLYGARCYFRAFP